MHQYMSRKNPLHIQLSHRFKIKSRLNPLGMVVLMYLKELNVYAKWALRIMEEEGGMVG